MTSTAAMTSTSINSTDHPQGIPVKRICPSRMALAMRLRISMKIA